MSRGLEAHGLSYRYGSRLVLDALDLIVEPGEIVGLLGPNGAGKTTAFKLLAGALKSRSGRILLDGSPLEGPIWRRARRGLSYVPQAPSVIEKMTVEQNVALGVRVRGDTNLDEILQRFGLAKLAAAPAAHLSGGERRRVELARAFASRSRIFLVDEPFSALDPLAVSEVSKHLQQCAADGVGVLLTDHYVAQALDLCHRIYILNMGQVICAGTSEDVAQNSAVRHTYLGASYPR